GVRHRFEGEIFGPSGAPFHASDAAKLRYGEAAGRVTLAFGADGTGTLSFDIGGIRGSKTLLAMAAAPEGLLPRAGAWAGDVSNPGWGLRITDNGDSLFVLWHTFDSDGRAAWFVMPAATLRDDGRI